MDPVTYKGLFLGYSGHGTIGKDKIFRVRRGNGHAGSILGKRYQEVKEYKVPANPQSVPQQENRAMFSEGLAEADGLSEEDKVPWKVKAYKVSGQTWRTLFMRAYMLRKSPPW